MQNTTEVMVASILAEGAVMGESVNKIIKQWRARGCTIPTADEKAIIANFGRRQGLDRLKIQILHFVIDYVRKNARDPELFRNIHPAPKTHAPPPESIEDLTSDDDGDIV